MLVLVDVDECMEGSHDCQEDDGFAKCMNTNGSYYCECHEGYEFPPGDEKVACVGKYVCMFGHMCKYACMCVCM